LSVAAFIVIEKSTIERGAGVCKVTPLLVVPAGGSEEADSNTSLSPFVLEGEPGRLGGGPLLKLVPPLTLPLPGKSISMYIEKLL
jgi:hypothetical protein